MVNIALLHLGASLIASLPIAYRFSRNARSNVAKRIFVGTIWSVFLGIPFIDHDEMQLHSFVTMALSSLAFMVPLKLTQMVVYPTKKRKEVEEEDIGASSSSFGWQDFAGYIGEILFHVLPVSKAKDEPDRSKFLFKTLECVFFIVVKMLAASTFQLLILRILERENLKAGEILEYTSAVYGELLVLFALSLVANSWQQDVQALMIHLVTLGRFEMLLFYDFVFLSSSLREFWGRRYNRLVNHLLLHAVYIPAQTYHKYSKRVSAFVAFAVSGVMHAYIAHFSFGRGHLRSIVFFVVQPIWIEIESHLRLPAGRTHFFFYLSSYLYLGLFVEAMPEWMDKNPLPATTPWIDDEMAPKLANTIWQNVIR